MLCDKDKKTRDDWTASVKLKFKAIAKKINATKHENKITEEMENVTKKYFNNERDLHTN